MLRVANVLASLALVGCDPVYHPLLCNGYNGPVAVSVYFQGGTGKLVANLLKGECSAGTLVRSTGRIDSSGVFESQHLAGVLVVEDENGKTLASYSEMSHTLILSGRSFSPQYLFTNNGIFLVPREFQYSWQEHISEIEKIAQATGSTAGRGE